MEKVTHYIDVRIGVDFGVVTLPKHIEGVKLALGTAEAGIPAAYAKMLVNEIESTIVNNRQDHLVMLDVVMNMVPEAAAEEASESEDVSGLSGYMEELGNELYGSDDSAPATLYASAMIAPNPDEVYTLYDETESILHDHIDDALMVVESYAGEDPEVYLREDLFSKYGIAVRQRFNLNVSELSEWQDGVDLGKDIDFAISYTTIKGEKALLQKSMKTKGAN